MFVGSFRNNTSVSVRFRPEEDAAAFHFNLTRKISKSISMTRRTSEDGRQQGFISYSIETI